MKPDLSHPLVRFGAPIAILAGIFYLGDYANQIAQKAPIHQPRTNNTASMSAKPLALPKVYADSNALKRLEGRTSIKEDLPSSSVVEEPVRKVQRVEILAKVLLFDAISSDGAFLEGGIFVPWGYEIEPGIILDGKTDYGALILREGMLRRTTTHTQF